MIERAAAAPAMTGEGQRLALLFTARHKPGQLAAALDQIGARGFNMECIKSRPLPHVPFEYYFYVQIVCPAGSTGEGADPAGHPDFCLQHPAAAGCLHP